MIELIARYVDERLEQHVKVLDQPDEWRDLSLKNTEYK